MTAVHAALRDRLMRLDHRYGALLDANPPETRAPAAVAPRRRRVPGPVRVGFFSPVLAAAGGTETWHTTLFGELAKHGRRVTNLGMAVAETDRCSVYRANLLRRHAPVAVGPMALAEIAKRAEVIVSWGLDPGPFVQNLGIPVLSVSHGDTRSQYTVAWTANCERSTTRFVAVHEVARQAVPSWRRPNCVVIPNGNDTGRLRVAPDARQRLRAVWGVPTDAKLIGTVQRLSDEKDPMALARAVASLPADWYGVLIGDGPDQARVIEHAQATAPGRIVFAGARHDTGDVYSALDWLLCPSTTEGFGLTIAEGWAVGVPVCSTPVGVVTDHPDCVRGIPFGADGQVIADAILAGPADVERAKAIALREYDAGLFAERWVRLLELTLGVISPDDLREADESIQRCPDRGPAIGHGCRCQWPCRRLGRDVTKRDCLECQLLEM